MSTRSKKKKSAREKERRRWQRRQEQRDVIELPVVYDPPGAAKMSAVLLDFIEPYGHLWHDKQSLEKLISMALVAWNAALMPQDKRESFLKDALNNSLPLEKREEGRLFLDELIRRKEEYFQGINRAMVDFRVIPEPGDSFYVQVISSLEERRSIFSRLWSGLMRCVFRRKESE